MNYINKKSGNAVSTNITPDLDDFNPDKIYVSGPINVARLEGKVNNIKKVIYLFMDVHVPVNDQTECTNVYSKDVNKYFADVFRQLNKSSDRSDTKYDFFMEIQPTVISSEKSYNMRKEKYIVQMAKFFSMAFSYTSKSNTVAVSDIYKNIRFHYLDIRDYLKTHLWKYFVQASDIATHDLYHNLNMNSIPTIIASLSEGKEYLDILITLLEKPTATNKKTPVIANPGAEFDPSIVSNFINKMKNRYTNPDVKTKINKIFNKLIVDFKKLSVYIGKSIEKIITYDKIFLEADTKLIRDDEYDKKIMNNGLSPYRLRLIVTDIANICEKISLDITDIFADLTDIYFMRRFLDKKYITNAVVYAGFAHIDNYIRILLTDFDFKLTHMAYSPITDVRKLEAEFRKRIKAGNFLTDLIRGTRLVQCSDLTSFPSGLD